MAFSSAFFTSQLRLSFKADLPRLGSNASCNKKIEMFGQPLGREVEHSFLRGSIRISKPNVGFRKGSAVSSLPCSQVASGAFTFGTAAVVPFYALMVVAPQAEFTKKIAASSLPYVLLGALYAYLLYLSWTPETIHLIFASKYWLPELPGMAKMFSSEMTLASAWIHLLTIDLFAARQVYGDGLQNNIETRHSVSLCLLSCPIGILAHALTKAITKGRREKKMEVITDEDPISTDLIK